MQQLEHHSHYQIQMTVKSEFSKTGGKYENKAYQIDFGNGYATEIVVNNVPKLVLKRYYIEPWSNKFRELGCKENKLRNL